MLAAMHAADIMIEALTVESDMPLPKLAELLLDQHSDGACVVDDGVLVGVVTSMDLVFQEKRVHLPSILSFMDFAIPLESPARLREELDKIAGTTVGEVMSSEPITASPDTLVSEIATRMVEDHLTLVPIVDGGRLVGVVTKPSLLRKLALEH